MRSALNILVASMALVVSAGAAAGPLDPPAGPVASTMKPLDQVEPRTAINSVNTPGDTLSVFAVTHPGSYYLTGNLTGQNGKVGIEIAASNVTIDLMGFTLQGVPGSTDGISANISVTNITIRNGVITGFGRDGVHLFHGGPRGYVIEEVCASSNGGAGLNPGSATVRWCTATLNAGDGIATLSGSLVESCLARANGGRGIFGGLRSIVRDCNSRENTGGGIGSSQNTLITGCLVTDNPGGGIITGGGSTIRDNTCTSNRNTAGDAAGILSSSGSSRIENNYCTGNSRGIRTTSFGSFIARNVCSQNDLNWDIAAGSVCVVVNAATSGAILGNSGGIAPGSADPNANFTY